ncbi:MAG TPA: CRISPR-associated endonuclease Cas2 [Candidatus Paceibacterota bacterium]|nr:CRISPR-associated endonuclease Cas2 [Candidatus Paceibacterota bacterium]
MKSRKNNKILKVLKAIGIGGMVLMALSHPAGGAAAIKWVNGASDRKKFKIQRAEFLKALWYLKKRKYVEVLEQNNQFIKIKISGSGIERIRRFDFDNLRIEPMRKWDKRWRIVLFDIPDTKKVAREALRRKLKELGFQRLQKSVFVCPWECVDEIIFLRKFFEIEPYVSIILAEAIDNEAAVYRKFDLSTA